MIRVATARMRFQTDVRRTKVKVIMDIVGIEGTVTVRLPDTSPDKLAVDMAIETVLMIKSNDIDIIDVIKDNPLQTPTKKAL